MYTHFLLGIVFAKLVFKLFKKTPIMKKLIALMVSLFVIQGSTMASDKKISMDQLPMAAQTFIKKNFPNVNTTSITMDEDDNDYTVKLSDGTKVDFDSQGMWEDIECEKKTTVPMSIIPTQIQTFLKTSYKGIGVKEIERKSSGGYELELSNGKELEFNSKFRLRM